MPSYATLRNIHLFCGVLALPALLLYGTSAVQMAHSRWFTTKPTITEGTLVIQPQLTDGRRVALDVMKARDLRGEITAIQTKPFSVSVRVSAPGTVHEISYSSADGAVRVRTSVTGFMGMLNRLHHAAGLWHDYLPLQLWGVLVAIISAATAVLGATGIWMWWMRRQDRKWGMLLLAANLSFSLVVLMMIRMAS